MVKYFWRGNELVVSTNGSNHSDCYCVDTGYTNAFSFYRHGMFTPVWKHIPFDEFPAEFKLHLLLLGIS